MAFEEDRQAAAIAAEWGVDIELLRDANWEIDTLHGNDGELHGYLIRFDDETSPDILEQLGLRAGEFTRQLSGNAFDEFEPDFEEAPPTPRQASNMTIRTGPPILRDGTVVEKPDPVPEALDGITAEEDFESLSASDQIQYMVDWFSRRYEDPALSLSYDGREGGYQWFGGGPYNAQDVLQEHFLSLAALETVQAAVDRIELAGVQWERIRTDEDDDQGFDPSSFDTGFAVSQEATLRARTIASLDQVDKLVEEVIAASLIGHNNPPEPIEPVPVSRQEFDSLRADLDRLREETTKTSPNAVAINDRAGRIRRFAVNAGAWVGQRITNMIDDPVKALGWTTAFSALVAALSDLVTNAQAWAHAIMGVF